MTIKRMLLSALLGVILIFGIDLTGVGASTADTLVVHYYRYDNDYTDWSVWLWQDGIAGAEVQFDGQDSYGKTATVDLIARGFNPNQDIGIIIAQIPEWIKDVEFDRFLDISQPDASGVVNAYLLQGEPFISYVATDQAGCDRDNPDPFECAQQPATGLLDAYFDDTLKLNFVSTDVVDAADITVYHEGLPVTFGGFSSGKTGALTLNESVVVSDVYTIAIDYNGTVVEMIVRVAADYDSSLFAHAYHYDGPLGIDYALTETTFRVWAPVSSAAEVNLYTAGHTTSRRADGADSPYAEVPMEYVGQGVWAATVSGDLHGVYYTFDVQNSGTWVYDVQDPYGLTFGLNGLRGMVVDLDRTDPDGWDQDQGVDGYNNTNEAIIYELHVRDLTSQDAWGGPEEYQGKYLGFTVENTSYTNNLTGVTVSTGLAHLIELGITHVHLLPTYDQDWNDEENFQFNWGYNPQHYNSPEGGYSTDPFDGAVRVREFKEMVMALHSNGINVITDMVYNHTGPGSGYSFNRIVPNYMYRLNSDGSFSNGTGVGNETASERYMFNKFMVDSMIYWAEEYHIDGFRFDLMAVHDYQTMNDVAEAVEAIDPDIFVYGEPWGGGSIALDWNLQAGKQNLYRMPLISAFNDQIRNAVKGSPDDTDAGYITNGQGIYDVMKGIEGSINWNFGTTSAQSINYVSAHDNKTLYDKLVGVHSSNGYTEEIDYEARLANAIVMFSQGVPFLHAGVDFLRTKGGDHNSYQSSDLVNQLNWVRKSNNVASFEYYKGIIEIRKEFDSFKMQTRVDIEANLEFLYPDGYGVIGYRLTKNDEDILVYHNGGAFQNDISLPSGAWMLIADRDEAGLTSLGTYETRYPIEEAETLVFVKGNAEDVIPSPQHKPVITNAIGVAYEGATVRINSTSTIAAYSIDGGDFVEVTVPLTYVNITGLTVGTHDIRIKDESGGISDPFTITILASNTDPTCDDGYTLVDGECVLDEEPPVCDDGYTLIGDECVQDEEPLVCDDGYSLVDGECVIDEPEVPDSGCFSTVGLSASIAGLLGILGGAMWFLRKQ